ncbi:hypothetical protein M0R04_11605 [Candidatus Dojkabacteria bacterium]|jgi:hypothetical protein|nr:hypothetical protein [Candidatus Dojkabacteria bacterium]
MNEYRLVQISETSFQIQKLGKNNPSWISLPRIYKDIDEAKSYLTQLRDNETINNQFTTPKIVEF